MKILRLFENGRRGNTVRQKRVFLPLMDGSRLEQREVPTATPIKIPLELVNIKTKQNPEYKLGIYVGLGGGPPKLYEFDTGGKGFWAAYSTKNPNSGWGGDFTTVETKTLTNTYSSGNSYIADLVSTSVKLYGAGENGAAPTPVDLPALQNVNVAQISKFTNTTKPATQVAWNKALKAGTPPLFGKFYGDFGAALAPVTSSGGTNIFSVLPQIQIPGLDVGYTVHVGTFPGDHQPYLLIGVDGSAPSGTTELAMNLNTQPDTGTPAAFPGTGVPAYSEQVANADVKLENTNTGHKQIFSNIGWTIDTGAPTATIWQSGTTQSGVNLRRGFFKSGSSSNLRDNLKFTISANSAKAGQPGLETSTRTGKPLPKIPLSAGRHTTGSGPQGWNYVNTGFWTFTQYDVSFNLSKGTVGFSSIDTNLSS